MEERSEVMDFSFKVLTDKVTLIVYRHHNTRLVNIWLYLKVFSPESWIFLLILSIILAVAFQGIVQFGPERLHQESDSEEFQFLNGLALVYLTLFQKDYPITKLRMETKILFITTCLSTCLLYTSPSPRDRQKSRMPSSA